MMLTAASRHKPPPPPNMNNLPEAVLAAIKKACVKGPHHFQEDAMIQGAEIYAALTTSQPQTDEGLVERMEQAIAKISLAPFRPTNIAYACAEVATSHMQPLVEALENVLDALESSGAKSSLIDAGRAALSTHKNTQK